MSEPRVKLELTYTQVGYISALLRMWASRLAGDKTEYAQREINLLLLDIGEQIDEQTAEELRHRFNSIGDPSGGRRGGGDSSTEIPGDW